MKEKEVVNKGYLDEVDLEFENRVRSEHGIDNPLIISEDVLAVAALMGTVKLTTVNKLTDEGFIVIQPKPTEKDRRDRKK